MMKLLSLLASPFGRKVMIVAAMKGVADRIEVQPTKTHPLNEELQQVNPLSKIPVLILPDGMHIFDSRVICEYLDSLSTLSNLFPASGRERFQMLTLAALADGILDAALLLVSEKRFRPEGMWVRSWMDGQQAKIDRALGWLEKRSPQWIANPDYSHITVACALGYLDFRQAGLWRATHPRMVAWLDAFERTVPSFDATRPA